MRIVMIGTCYVGLVSGACLADFGHRVVCIDNDGAKLEILQRGEIPIYEPGLRYLVRSNVKGGGFFLLANSRNMFGPQTQLSSGRYTAARRSPRGPRTCMMSAARLRCLSSASQSQSPSQLFNVGTCDEIQRIIHQERHDADVAVREFHKIC